MNIFKKIDNNLEISKKGFYAQQLLKDQKKDWTKREKRNIHGEIEEPNTAHNNAKKIH